MHHGGGYQNELDRAPRMIWDVADSAVICERHQASSVVRRATSSNERCYGGRYGMTDD